MNAVRIDDKKPQKKTKYSDYAYQKKREKKLSSAMNTHSQRERKREAHKRAIALTALAAVEEYSVMYISYRIGPTHKRTQNYCLEY